MKSVVRKYISPRINFCLYIHFMPVSSKRATERARELAIPMKFRQSESQSYSQSVTVEGCPLRIRGERHFGEVTNSKCW